MLPTLQITVSVNPNFVENLKGEHMWRVKSNTGGQVLKSRTRNRKNLSYHAVYKLDIQSGKQIMVHFDWAFFRKNFSTLHSRVTFKI